MRYALLLFATVIFTMPVASSADDGKLLTSVKMEDVTPSDVPLKFTPQKIKWQYNRVFIWGLVTNSASAQYKSVGVSLTALDENRQFLGRMKQFTDPMDVGGQTTGNIDSAIIETEGRVPAIIQFKVSGTKAR